MYAAEQGNVTVRCNPEAAPRPQFEWRKDGSVIGKAVVFGITNCCFKMTKSILWLILYAIVRPSTV